MSWPRLRAKHTSVVYCPEFTQFNVDFCKEPRALGRETPKDITK